MMKRWTRRALWQRVAILAQGLVAVRLGSACERVIEVERVVEKEVTKVVTEVVRETVIVEKTSAPTIPTILPTPTVRGRVTVVADVLPYAWTRFAQLVAPAFEEMFPQIRLAWRIEGDWSGYSQRIATLFASGQLGDLVEAPIGTLLSEWARRRIIQPLDDIIEADGFSPAGIFTGALKACQDQGQQMGLPFIANGGDNVLVYNRGLFTQSDVGLPASTWTLDDLSQAAAALTRDLTGDGRTDQFGYAVQWHLPGCLPLLELFGASLIAPDGQSCAIEEAGGLACLGWLYEQVRVRRVAPSPMRIDRGLTSMFLTGAMAMLRQSFARYVDLRRATPAGLAVGATPFVKHPVTGSQASSPRGMAYAISSRTRYAPEAFQWIKVISSREMGVQMFLGGYADPGCRLSSWKDARVLESFPLCAQLADVADAAQSQTLPWNLRLSECYAAWDAAVTALLQGESSPEECAARIAREVNAVLRRSDISR